MVSRITTIGTSDVSPTDSIAFWGRALASLCGKLHTDAYGAGAIEGRIDYATIGRLKLCHIEASQHRVALSKELARTEMHPVIKIILQLRGDSVYEQGDERLVVSPGDCLAYDVSRPHRVTSLSSSKHFVVIIPKDIASLRGIELGRLSAQRFSAREGVGRLASGLVTSTFHEMPTLDSDCDAELAETILGMLHLSLMQNDRCMIPAEPCLRRQIKALIHKNLHDPDLSIENIAATLDRTKRYLHLSFAEEGMTISEYIWAARLEHCRRELAVSVGSGKTITDIAFSWGFSSSAHFSRSFKKRFGISPSAARRSL